jgi:hypothetical protein
MNVLKNTLAVLTGLIIGSLVNSVIIYFSNAIITPPIGVDVKTLEGLKAGIHLFEPRHFIFPFLAHAIGTFIGAILTTIIAVTHKLKFAMAIGIVFLMAGIANVMMIPAPIWFNIVDLAFAYIPMAFLAHKLAYKNKP